MFLQVVVAVIFGSVGLGVGWRLRGRADSGRVVKSEVEAWRRAREWGGKYNGKETRGGGLPW